MVVMVFLVRRRIAGNSSILPAACLIWAGLAAGGLTAEPLDLDDPTGAVKGLRKLQCHMEDGKPAIFWWSGVTYSRVPGEKDRLLFEYEGMNVRACVTVEDPERGYGYRMGRSADRPRESS